MTTPSSPSSPPTPPPSAERTPPPTAPVPAPMRPPAPRPERSPEEVTRDIETERVELVAAVSDLRASVDRVGKKAARAAKAVPALIATGIVLGTAAKVARRKRHPEPDSDTGNERLRFGRWSLNEHDDD